jgi:hypothetical protein
MEHAVIIIVVMQLQLAIAAVMDTIFRQQQHLKAHVSPVLL